MPRRVIPTAQGPALAHSRPTVPVRRCGVCQQPETLTTLVLCDGVMPGGTCAMPVCRPHAVHVAPDLDFCPRHVPGPPG